jgi:hypothetical protein
VLTRRSGIAAIRHPEGGTKVIPPECIADLNKIAEIDRDDLKRSRGIRIAMGEIWHKWKDDAALATVPLHALAPLLRRDRPYLQRCLLLYEWHRIGLIDQIAPGPQASTRTATPSRTTPPSATPNGSDARPTSKPVHCRKIPQTPRPRTHCATSPRTQ